MIIHLYKLPDPELNPNKRLHYMKLYQAKLRAKEEVYLRFLEQCQRVAPFVKAHVDIKWIAKDNRRRDVDNLFASMKPYIDGLVWAEVLTDDSAELITYSLSYEKGNENDTIISISADSYK